MEVAFSKENANMVESFEDKFCKKIKFSRKW